MLSFAFITSFYLLFTFLFISFWLWRCLFSSLFLERGYGENAHLNCFFVFRCPVILYSLVGYSPWGCNESDMMEWLTATNPNLKNPKLDRGSKHSLYDLWLMSWACEISHISKSQRLPTALLATQQVWEGAEREQGQWADLVNPRGRAEMLLVSSPLLCSLPDLLKPSDLLNPLC